MASNESLTDCMEPCIREKNSSLESVWLTGSDFGECAVQASDPQLYPCLVLLYNGEILKISSELIHESLSGISIRHYYGKCYQEPTEDEESFSRNGEGEMYAFDLFGSGQQLSTLSSIKQEKEEDNESTSESGCFEYQDSRTESFVLMQPICTRARINLRNSFWNLHRPELSKLTWPQKYVSTATVTKHLHNHLTSHGPFCNGIHEEEDQIAMLDNELDEYGRLKEIASPREIPPDEKLFNFKTDAADFLKAENPRCKGIKNQPKTLIEYKDRFLQISDDEDEMKNIHRSKEEFCLTIGRHIRKPTITKSISTIEEGYHDFVICPGSEEEGESLFYFNWHLYQQEQSFEGNSDESLTDRDIEPEPDALVNPCPPLKMDDFCRAAAKADFSDLRCNPDF